MKHQFLILALALITGPLFSKSISLEDLQKTAFKNNYMLNAARINTEMAYKEQLETTSDLYPKLGFKLGIEKTTSSAVDFDETDNLKSIYGEYNLFNGFRDQNKLDMTKVERKLAESDLKESEFRLHLQVEHLYFSYLYLTKKIKSINQAIIRNQKHIELIKIRLASGLVTKTDLLEFQLRRSKLKSKRDFYKLRSEETRENVFRVVGLESYKQASISGELPHFEIDTSLEKLLVIFNKNNESIKRSELHLEKSEYDSKIANSGWYPSIDLIAEHGNLNSQETGIDSDETTTSIAVMARWEIFSGFKTKYALDKANLGKLKDEYLLKQTFLDNSSMLRTQFQKLKAIESRIKYEEDNLKIAKELYTKTLKEYRKGVKDSGALSSAGDELTSISDQVYGLKMDFIKEKLSLESVLGTHLLLKKISHH